MENLCLAKSKPVQTVKEHTDEVLHLLQRLFAVYPQAFSLFSPQVRKSVEWAVRYHDIGKLGIRFQNKLYRTLGQPLLADPLENQYQQNGLAEFPHGVLSAGVFPFKQVKAELGREWATAIIQAIGHHHARELLERLVEHTPFLTEVLDYELQIQEDVYRNHGVNPEDVSAKQVVRCCSVEQFMDDESWLRLAVIKGVLNRVDYAASAGLNAVQFEIEHSRNQMNLPQAICRTFGQHLREVQQYMQQHQQDNLLVLASTGIGKTEAALLWANEEKCFYTLPLKVSINAIYDRIRNEQGYAYANVELLHSDAVVYYLNEQPAEKSVLFRHKQARLLAHPLTICTVDQLFKFVYRFNGCEAAFATLAYSKVVIDEIQMYSPDVTAAIIYGLYLVTKAGGKFAIITATMPRILIERMKKLGIPFKESKPYFSTLQRHRIALYEHDLDIERLWQAGKEQKVLVLANTVRKAQALYQAFRQKGEAEGRANVWLVHSNFIRRDRAALEKKILQFANPDERTTETGIWIATQIVEASLNVDFDLLATEMCTADSLLQRLGRCYRKRQYTGTEANVWIYNTRNGVDQIYDKDIYRFSWEALRQYDGMLFDEPMKHAYIEAIYDETKNPAIATTSYIQAFDDKIKRLQDMGPFFLKKEEVDVEFRNLQSIKLMPERIYQGLQKAGEIERWQTTLASQESKVEAKIRAEAEIGDFIISMSLVSVPYDKDECIYAHSGIHRTDRLYEFDEDTCQGRGLVRTEADDEQRFIVD